MNEDLMPLIRGYLESDRFRILEDRPQFLIADKLIFAQDHDTRLIWTIPAGVDPTRYEATLRPSILSTRPNYPDARAYVVADSKSGLSRDLLQLLADQRVNLRVPIQFFDADFKVEDRTARAARSAIADVLADDLGEKRVVQPYRSESADGRPVEGVDLFSELLEELTQDQSPRVNIVVGRAGIGKSSLFNALFSRLYGHFLDAKRRLEVGRRPIPMVVQHMRDVMGYRTELLVENFLRLDVAQPLSRDTFEWLLVNGFTTWLMDGLDELYAGDHHFFEYLADLLTRRTDSKTQVTLWCRDSVLTTSSDFLEFQQFLSADRSLLRIYHLEEWRHVSKHQFAWLNLEGRKPQKDEADSVPVREFMTQIEKSPTLRSMSGLPFYCSVLLQDYRDGTLRDFHDDVDMLDHFVDRMIKREEGKGLLDVRAFVPGGLDDWLEDIAARYFEDGYIDQAEAVEYGRIVLRDAVREEEQNHILESLLQFPLFAAGQESGRIAFAHGLISEVLAARRYLRLLRQRGDATTIANRLSRVDMENPTLLRFIARRMDVTDTQALIATLQQGGVGVHGFAALLTLLMMARPERSVLKDARLSFEGRNLGAVRFTRRDLSSVSFRTSDLSLVTFEDCDLGGALFEGAFFSQTRFLGECNLKKAQFGDLSRIESLYGGPRLIDDQRHIKEWIARVTGQPEVRDDPCPTAMQVRALFGKFITPLGEARRDDLRHDALVSGKRFSGSAPSDECVRAAVSYGYLDAADYRNRLRRAAGDRYAEMVRLVRESSISDGLGRLIGEICARPGCTHQLNA